MANSMKIIFICEDEKGDQFTPEFELCCSIENAAKALVEIIEYSKPIQAIDIADLQDIEDVSELVAQEIATFELKDAPEKILGIDLEEIRADIAENAVLEATHQKQLRQDYHASVL